MDAELQKSSNQRLVVILAVTLAVSVMNATMFSIALPEIQKDFNLTLSKVAWVNTAYLLIFAIGSLLYGKLADIFRLKMLITVGFSIFTLGSVVGMFSGTFGWLLAGRVLQAAGAAVIPALSGIVPMRYFPIDKRGRALGIAMTGGAVGSAAGPALAALLLSAVHWRWMFILPLMTLLLIPLYYKYLENEQSERAPIDWFGCALLTGSAALLLLAIASERLEAAAGCIAMLAALVWRIRRAPVPFIHPSLFGNKRFSLLLVISMAATGTGYALAFLTPNLIAQVQHLQQGMAGFIMLPAAVSAALLSKPGGRIADVKGASRLFLLAISLFLICFILFASFTAAPPYALAAFLIFGSIGQLFMSISLSKSASAALPQEHSGTGMGLLSMLNFISGALFASFYGQMVDHGAKKAWNPLVTNPDAYVYSNIYIVLILFTLGCVCLYALQPVFSRVR